MAPDLVNRITSTSLQGITHVSDTEAQSERGGIERFAGAAFGGTHCQCDNNCDAVILLLLNELLEPEYIGLEACLTDIQRARRVAAASDKKAPVAGALPLSSCSSFHSAPCQICTLEAPADRPSSLSARNSTWVSPPSDG